MSSTLDPQTHMGAVSLTVSDLTRSLAFYNQLGFKLLDRNGKAARIGAPGRDLVILNEVPDARPVTPSTGLYHFAVLVPSRKELGYVLKQIARRQIPVQGFADHGVSEAIYLPDPDGNGIEIYRDRPRDEWPHNPDGSLAMVSDPLDLEGIVGELEGQPEEWAGLHKDTVMGHMHLRVADIPTAEAFYQQVVGFDVMQHFSHSASFISAGGYHHHIGMNVWESRGASPAPAGSAGLNWYEVVVPTEAEANKVADRVRKADVTIEEHERGLLLRDPSHNGLMLAVEG
jgi:catechol 2,3-dioxygenase